MSDPRRISLYQDVFVYDEDTLTVSGGKEWIDIKISELHQGVIIHLDNREILRKLVEEGQKILETTEKES